MPGGLTRAKSTLKNIFGNKRKQQKEPGRSASVGDSAQSEPANVNQSTAPTLDDPDASTTQRQPESDGDMEAAVQSAGNPQGNNQASDTPTRDTKLATVNEPEATTTTEPATVSKDNALPSESTAATEEAEPTTIVPTSDTKAPSTEPTSDLTAEPEAPSQHPTSEEIEDVEKKEAQAVVAASQLPAKQDPETQADLETSKQTSDAMRTAVDQAGAGGSMMGMSATSGPLSDQPAHA